MRWRLENVVVVAYRNVPGKAESGSGQPALTDGKTLRSPPIKARDCERGGGLLQLRGAARLLRITESRGTASGSGVIRRRLAVGRPGRIGILWSLVLSALSLRILRPIGESSLTRHTRIGARRWCAGRCSKSGTGTARSSSCSRNPPRGGSCRWRSCCGCPGGRTTGRRSCGSRPGIILSRNPSGQKTTGHEEWEPGPVKYHAWNRGVRGCHRTQARGACCH